MSVDGQDESPGGGAEVSRRVPGQDGPPEHITGGDGPYGGSPGAGGLPAQRARGALPPSDAELITRMRDGDDTAYEELYRRHAEALRRYARSCCRDAHTADDLTAEVFARMLQAVRAGSGPQYAVRAYLLTTVRRIAATWTKSARREQLVDDFALFAAQSARLSGEPDAAPSPTPGSFDAGVELGADVRAMHEAERSMARAAFRSLPERWQAVLWHTEVEEESPSEIATLFGLDANGARVLASRAREGLRQAYLQAHVSAALVADEECARYAGQLGTYARRRLRTRAEQGLRRHLEECARCRLAVSQIEEIANGIPAVVPVAVIGWFGAAGYAKALGIIAGGAGAAAGGAAGAAATAAGGSGSASTGGAATLSKGLGLPLQAGIAAGVVAVAATVIALATVGHHAPATKPEARPSASRAVESRATESREPAPAPPQKGGRASAASPHPSATSATSSAPAPRTAPAPVAGPAVIPVVAVPPTSARSGPVGTPSPAATPAPTPTSSTPPAELTPAPSPPGSAFYWWNRLSYDMTTTDRDRPVMRLDGSSWVWRRWGVWIAERHYARGVTVQGASSVVIELNRPCSSFDALAGIDDLTVGPAGVRFSVLLDGARAWRSPVLGSGDRVVPVHVGLAGHRTVRLVVEPGTRQDAEALVDWAQARFTCR